MYKDRPIKIYLDDLAARLPAPGGGSACASCAAMAAALVSMVVNFTLGRPKYARYEKDLKDILDKSESLRREFLRLMDLDVAAYKSGDIRDALNVPFMAARLCFEGMKLCPELTKKGNINLISDVAIAAVLFEAGFASAGFNVEVNLKNLNDKKLTLPMTRELKEKGRLIRKLRAAVEGKVGKIIRG